MSEFKKVEGFRGYCMKDGKIIRTTDKPVELNNYHVADRLFCDGGCFESWLINEYEDILAESG